MQKLPQADGGAADLDKLDGLDARGECARGSAAGSAAKQATGGASSATETAVAPFSASGSGGGGGGPGASDAPGAEVRVRECVKAYRLFTHTPSSSILSIHKSLLLLELEEHLLLLL